MQTSSRTVTTLTSSITLLTLGLLQVSSAVGIGSCVPFRTLADRAELIVVVDVDAIQRLDSERLAHARVREVWKGAPVREVLFYARPVNPFCDATRAEVGDALLLFLEHTGLASSFADSTTFSSVFRIVSGGYGQFKIVPVGEEEYVVTKDGTLSNDVPTRPLKGFLSNPISDLRKYISTLPRDLEKKGN